MLHIHDKNFIAVTKVVFWQSDAFKKKLYN